MTLRALTPLEARVLAVLVEKHHTVPDTYPLSLNALVAGCNQKTARAPVMEASESDVIVALDGLKQLHLVEVSGSRVARYEHNAPRGLGVPSQSVALLTTLMLRGPQTAAELRLNSERLHKFADVSSVEAFLDELSSKEPARVVKLPRAPGAREARWTHLLSGEPSAELLALSASTSSAADSVSAGELSVLKAEVARLSGEMQALRVEVLAMQQALGISPSTEA
ncbi:YceH family protein [Ideonella sp.]|jgi:uncharacterized protein YceH (UPF0502 family)|uniref:YceH family protein n=1 Tax=Ideonella sp. TaxID=1929293 RepID=UPI0037BEDB48